MKQYPIKRGEGKQQIIYLEQVDQLMIQIKTPIQAIYVPMVEESK